MFSRARRGLLAAISEEITSLADGVVRSTAIVTGQTKNFTGGSGSAWLYDRAHLVTNHHVVEDLVSPLWVRFPDCQETTAMVVGVDPLTDLAVLRVQPQQAEPLVLRQTRARLGELCFALGSPLGQFPESMSFGIVSGLHRTLPTTGGRSIADVIQTDCAINPGNSGGPLLDVEGRVLGVNTAIAGGAEGIGFAVPVETVADIIPELLTHGEVVRASLGVTVAVQQAEGNDPQRLVVTAVRSTAAGPLLRGDVLLCVGAHEVRSAADLFRVLRREVLGQPVPVTVRRSDADVVVTCHPTLLGSRS